jgi:small subunit ribosomal protein S2
MANIKFEDLLGSGAHFGHVTRKWNPNYKPYILMEKNGVHIINLDETIRNLNNALDFISSKAKNKGEFLFVGTKKQARDIVQQEADRCSMFYVVERWLGGTLTNFSTIKKSIKRLNLLEKEGSRIYENQTKKEIQMLNRERIKLSDQHRGIKDMRRLPDAIIIVDANLEITAVKEANVLGIPIIALVDSNTDPTPIQYPIPANDDSIRTIQLIMKSIADQILESSGKTPKIPVEVEEAVVEEAVVEEAVVEEAVVEEAVVEEAVVEEVVVEEVVVEEVVVEKVVVEKAK